MNLHSINTLFDVSALCSQNISGVGVYVKNLYEELSSSKEIHVKGVWKFNQAFKSRHLSKHISGQSNIFFPSFSNILNHKFNVFHGPDFNLYCGNKFKTVLTLHDFAFFEDNLLDVDFAKYYKEKVDFILRKKTPDRIITVSNFTKEKLIEKYPSFEKKVFTVHHGVNHLLSLSSKKEPKTTSNSPYFLFVGNIERRKNIIALVKAFQEVNKKHPEFKLKIIGKDGFDSNNIHKFIHQSKIKNKIDVIQNVNIYNLIQLYQNAFALTYPSLYEGFGFPILEAMSLGCPVITSNFGAMKEISGDCAVQVQPNDIESISSGMLSLITNPSYRKNLISNGYNRAQQFTWKKCAIETIRAYQS